MQKRPGLEARRPSRARAASASRLDQRMSEAVLGLLREGGPAAVTMESVAARAGIAKTSIYRRHANRGELLTAVLTVAIGTPGGAPRGNRAGEDSDRSGPGVAPDDRRPRPRGSRRHRGELRPRVHRACSARLSAPTTERWSPASGATPRPAGSAETSTPKES